ncbi:MAG: hypothetical protein JW718_05215 [Desulfovibrionaceae bacterium]|nr:hypothetical protein [Desulfovibrionaceae bacterium]
MVQALTDLIQAAPAGSFMAGPPGSFTAGPPGQVVPAPAGHVPVDTSPGGLDSFSMAVINAPVTVNQPAPSEVRLVEIRERTVFIEQTMAAPERPGGDIVLASA